jgi:hypothetical protein
MAVSWAIAACQHGEPCFDLIEQKNFVYSGVADVTANGDAFIKAGGCEIMISGSDREHSRLAAHFELLQTMEIYFVRYILLSLMRSKHRHTRQALSF